MSTLKTNNIQHVDRSEPSIIINTDGSVNIAGTVSYEDSTNVDSVGVVTARKQLHVGTGVSIAAGGLNVTAGITTVQALQATTGDFSVALDIADSLRHIGDNDTRIRFPSADTITAETAGSERLRITSDGKIGIGSEIPSDILDIQTGSSDEVTKFKVKIAGQLELTRNHADAPFIKTFMSSGNPEIRLGDSGGTKTVIHGHGVSYFNAGNVGIGISNPDELLHIFSSSSNSKIVLEADNNSANNGIFWVDEGDNTQSEFFYDHGGNKQNLKVNGNGFEIYSKQTSSVIANIGHGSGYNEVLVPNGDVGIGTVTPGSRLDVRNASGTDPLVSFHHSNADVEGEVIRIGRVDLPAIRYHSIKAKHGGAAANNYISFNLHNGSSTTSQSEVLRILGNGTVGIGTDAPENDFHIMDGSATMKLTSTTSANSTRLILESESDSYGGVHFGDPSDEDAGRIRYYHGGSYPNSMRFATNATDEMMIHNGGPVSFNSGIELGSGLDATTANTLDDYEEGVYAPTLTGSAGGGYDVNTSYNKLAYTKVGRIVHVTGRLRLSAKNSPSGDYIKMTLPTTSNVLTGNGDAGRIVGTVYVQSSGKAVNDFVILPTQGGGAYLFWAHVDFDGTGFNNMNSQMNGDELVSVSVSYVSQ